MNKNQKVVLFYTAILIGCLTIYPPYIYKLDGGAIIGGGFSFFFSPPSGALINTSLLLTEYIGALIVGGLLTFAFKDKK